MYILNDGLCILLENGYTVRFELYKVTVKDEDKFVCELRARHRAINKNFIACDEGPEEALNELIKFIKKSYPLDTEGYSEE
jgi:hypothetical protein